MTSVGDPVGRGFIASLARPGGNITGVSNQAVELTGKWVELLKETLPKVSRVAVLKNPDNPSHAFFWREAERAAQSVGVRVYSADFRRPEDLESTFAAIVKELVEAMIVLPDPMTGANRARIIDLATQKRLASIAAFTEFPRGGALMSYGPSLISNSRRAAVYVDTILKGANPAELPVEQPTKFELVINLKTAKALGLTIPPSVLGRADEVIK
jgi:putative ABC transport system substrate-binding protein